MIYKATINDKREISVDLQSDGTVLLDGKIAAPDVSQIKDGIYHIIHGHKSFNSEVIKYDKEERLLHIRVNNNVYKVQLRDRFDELLHELGMDAAKSKKVSELKAPMPGLVVEVCVSEGQEVKKGDKLVVLEAMKMENILKAPADSVVKKISITKGQTVEKNEALILFV
jgi:acetyl/propionyl-CoA carboxylase alpha subunit